MSRTRFWVLLMCVCLLSLATCFGQGEKKRGLTDFTGTTGSNDAVVEVQQNGSVAQPSVTDLPPAAIQGDGSSTSGSSIGVLGSSEGSFGLGVVGIATGTPGSQETPSGVTGIATAASGRTHGVTAIISSPDGSGLNVVTTGGKFIEASNGSGNSLLFFDVDGSGTIATTGLISVGIAPGGGSDFFHVDQFGNTQVTGNLFVSGTKSSIAELQSGRRVAMYAVESPENWFEDFGTAQLEKGKAQVKLESVFAETVNPDLSYHVFLTPNGNCRGLYIAEKTATGFVVRELGGGKSTISFDYRVVVRRKGYEKVRLAEVPAQQVGTSVQSVHQAANGN